MITEFAASLGEEVNARLDPASILTAVDFHADKIQKTGETIKAFCPIHKDSRFRSLLIDAERKAFRCTIKTCRGYSGGSLLELYAHSREISLLAATCELVQRLEIELEPGWRDQLVASYLSEAGPALERGDFTDAETLLREIISIAPETPDARVMLARVKAEMGNPQGAAEEYTQLIDQLLQAGRVEDADRLLIDALKHFPDNEDLLFVRIRIAEALDDNELTIKRMEEVIQIRDATNRQLDNIGLLEQLVKRAVNRPDLAIKLAELYEQQHNVRAAARQYEDAARTYLANGQVSEGIELLEKVVQFNSENVKARLELANRLAENNDIDRARAHTFRVVNQQIDQQEFGLAVATINGWLEREPESIDSRELLARIYQDQERPDNACDYLVEGAVLAAKAGDNRRAADLLLRAKFLKPDEAHIRQKLLDAFDATGELQRAAFEMVDLAEIFFSSDRTDEAVRLLKAGLEKGISIPLKLQMVSALAHHGQTDIAKSYVRKMASAIEASTPPDEVADIYETLVRLEPEAVDKHLQLVDSLWVISPERATDAAADSIQWLHKNNHTADAEILLESTVSKVTEYVPAALRLFELCETLNRIDLAGALYQVSIQGLAEADAEAGLRAARRMAVLDPGHSSAASDIAFLLATLGRTEEAADHYARLSATLRDHGDNETALEFAREARALAPASVKALAMETLLSHEALTPEETAVLADELLLIARSTDVRDDAAIAYLTYTDIYPENVELIKEAISALEKLAANDAVAQLQARRASMLSATGDWEGASSLLAKAAEAAPLQAPIHEQLGEAFRISGRTDDAAVAFARAASVYARQGDIENAVRCVESARHSTPTTAAAWEALFNAADAARLNDISKISAESLAQRFATEGPPQAAARWSREWVRLDQENAQAHYTLGVALGAIDQADNAVEALSKAAQLYAANDQHEVALQAMEQLALYGNLTPQNRDTLSAIVSAHSAGTDIHLHANQLLGTALVHAGELAAARKLAGQLPQNKAAATLWTALAGVETNATTATSDYLNAARAFESDNRPDEAIAVLQAAAQLDQSNYEIHALLGELLSVQDRYSDALPHQVLVLQKRALEKSSGLKAFLKQLRESYAGDTNALLEIAKALLAAGQSDLAKIDLEAAAQIATASNNAAALVDICGLDEEITRNSLILTRARADSLMGMENAEQALDWVAKSGRQLMESGKAAEAYEMGQRWVSLSAKDPKGYLLQAEALHALGKGEDSAKVHITAARLLQESGNQEDALAEVETILKSSPGLTAALQLKGELLQTAGDLVAASKTFASLGDVYRAAAAEEKALAAYRACLQISPDHTDALWNQAELVQELEGAVAARPFYRQWIKARRDTVDQKQYIADLKQVLELMPDSVTLLREISETFIAVGSASDALPYLADLADMLETEGDYTGAAEVYETSLSHSPAPDPTTHVIVAELYKKANNLSVAQDHLRQAGRLYIEKGSNEEAVDALESLLKIAGDGALPEDFAMAAGAYAAYGDTEAAVRLIDLGLENLKSQSSNRERREAILAKALEIAPLNMDYVMAHMELLPPSRAMTEGLHVARKMTSSGQPEDAIKVLTQVVALAPHDMSLRQEMFEPLRKTGNTNRLRQELQALASDALAAGDADAAYEALDEAGSLAKTAQHYRTLAEINERARRTEEAVEQFVKCALMFAGERKNEQSIACINRAVSVKPLAFPADSMAELVYKLGSDVHDIAREQLRSALMARRQKQSQVLALALLDTGSVESGFEILKTVHTLGGSTFVVGIARERIKHLEQTNDLAGALALVDQLMTIAPDSPDAWYLSAKVNRQAGNNPDARRAAMEAARLFNMAGAVIEEEDCYEEALAAEPDNVTVKATLADYLVREHREDKAVGLLLEIIAAAELSGNSDVVLDSLNRAVQVAPANTDLREKLATTLESIAPDSAIDNWLQLAEILSDNKEPDRARRVYGHVLTLHPQNERALLGLLDHARNTGDLDRAARYTVALAEVKASKKNVGEACRIYQAYLQVDPDNLEILERLSALAGTSNDGEVFTTTTTALAKKFQKMGDNESALKHYELLVERNPRDAVLLAALLDCTAAAGNAEKGLVYARQLLAVARETEDPEKIRLAAATILNYDQEDASAHNDLGEALLSLNKVQQAVTEWMRAAELFEGSGNTAAAFTCYRRITQISPGTTQAWRRLGDLALNVGDVETARMCLFHVLDKTSTDDKLKVGALLTRMLQALPDDRDIHQTAVDFYMKSGDREKAAMELHWLAKQAESLGDGDKAASFLSEALQLAPDNPELKAAHFDIVRKLGRLEEIQAKLRQQAVEHEQQGHIKEAIKVLYELSEISMGHVPLHRDLARLLTQENRLSEAIDQHLHVVQALLNRGDLEEAREYAETVVKSCPKESDCHVRIADMLMHSAYPDLAGRYYRNAADMALESKDYDSGIQLLQQAIEARPSWIEARESLAVACEKAGRTDDAFKARIGQAHALIEDDELSSATTILNKLRTQQPDSPAVREQLADLHEKSGNRDEQAVVLKELAELYGTNGDHLQALDIYRKLASLTPEDPDVLSRYVEVLTQAEVPPEELPKEYARLADAYASRGDVESAMRTYEQALGMSPENTATRSRYATFLLSRGSRNRALTEMRNLAKLYMERSEPVAAVEVLNAALTITPRDADLCLALAAAQEAAEMHEDARVTYARASAILASTAAVKGIDTYRRILTQDENNTAVRLRLVELLINADDKMEAAREARILAEIHINRGELAEAENAYRLVDNCEPETLEDVREAIRRDSYDPSLQYVHYVRLGNRQFDLADVDGALDSYRTARSLHDDQPELIQKCIECVSLIAPEAEAIPDYLLLGEKLLMKNQFTKARKAYETVRLLDPFNNDAKCGLEAVNAAERNLSSAGKKADDELVLKSSRVINKRVALMDLLVACQDAAQDPALSSDSDKLGTTRT